MSTEDHIPINLRLQFAVYGSAMFSNSALQLYNVVVPLWAVTLTQDPLIIGIIFGARHFLPMLLLIHGGAMMDRFGTRKIMLFFASLSLIIPLLYPSFPWIYALIVLQMLGGLAVMSCWIGAQSLTGELMQGKPVYSGRLTLSTRIGTFVGPPVVGAIWDFSGPWAAFSFISFWAALCLISTILLPTLKSQHLKPRVSNKNKILGIIKESRPKLSDYIEAFRLIAIPAILLVFLVTMLRHSGSAMQANFYVVYLNGIGISGTFIGLLFSFLGASGGAGAISVGWLSRRFSSRMVLIAANAAGVLMITLTPVIGESGFNLDADVVVSFLKGIGLNFNIDPIASVFGIYILFLFAIGVRGASSGVSQAMEISLIAQASGTSQGKGAALRVTAGRIAAVFLPIFMGAIAKFFGIEISFYVVGVSILLVLSWLGLKEKNGSIQT